MPETKQHKLESRPGIQIEVLAQYAEIAERLIRYALGQENLDPFKEFPFLNDESEGRNILGASMSLSGRHIRHPEDVPRMKDRIYIEVCLYGARKEGLLAVIGNDPLSKLVQEFRTPS